MEYLLIITVDYTDKISHRFNIILIESFWVNLCTTNNKNLSLTLVATL